MALFKRKNHPLSEGNPAAAVDQPAKGAPEDDDWRAYDSVARTYAEVLDRSTLPPARDLVQLLKIGPAAAVLDVGSGTGAGARAAAEATGGNGIVVGIDPSLPMLSLARGRAGARYAAAIAIDLPFRDATFTHVVANFVLSHFERYDTALFDILRVLKQGGRLGATAWAAGEDDDDFSRAWESVAEEFAEHEILTDAHDRAVPWEERFADPVELKDALHEAGLRDIWVERRDYRVEVTAEEYLASRDITSAGRFLHQMLGEELWGTFQARTCQVFAERFPPAFHDFHQVVLAVGHKG